MLIGTLPVVGMGNQAIVLIAYLVHAIVSERALFISSPLHYCSENEVHNGVEYRSLLCDDFHLRHET